MITKGHITFVVFATLVMSLVVGCSAGAPVPLPTPGPASGPFPTGIFAYGTYLMSLGADGSYSVATSGKVLGAGPYNVNGDQITFNGSDCADEGTYTWIWDGKVLVFKLIEDRCVGRVDITKSALWAKAP